MVKVSGLEETGYIEQAKQDAQSEKENETANQYIGEGSMWRFLSFGRQIKTATKYFPS